MSNSSLVNAIHTRLKQVGYRDLSTPFKVANVEFSFTSAMRGTDGRALDLILLVDTTTGDFGDRDAIRVRQRIEALSRALDVTGSRYVVTAILAGAVLAESIDLLSETCRVLQVEAIPLNDDGQPQDEVAARQLDDRIRVLLPLTLPEALTAEEAGSGTAMQQLIKALPVGTSRTFFDAVTVAAENGEQAVTDAAAAAIEVSFHSSDQEQTA